MKHSFCVVLFWLCAATVAPAQKLMTDPLFGISYDRQRIHFQKMPNMLVEHCPQLQGRYVAAWTYGHFKTTDSEYFLISGLIESHADEPGGATTIAPEEEGLAVALQGEKCLVDQADYFLSRRINPAKTATPITTSDSILTGILQDAFKRYVVAFGGKQAFVKNVKPVALLPIVRSQFEAFEKKAGNDDKP